MRIVVTGADGFLGWHLRCRLAALTDHEVVPVSREALPGLADLAIGADAIVHLAGVNRAPDQEVEQGNIDLAHLVADAAKRNNVPRVVYANSIQHGNGTPSGTGKARAAEILADEVRGYGGAFADVRRPNLFGEHGRPRYNSFVATFAHAVVTGETMDVADREIDLLPAQAAAGALIDGLTTTESLLLPAGHTTTVVGVLDTLRSMNSLYNGPGDIPPLPDQFHVDLFNTLRAALFWPHTVFDPDNTDTFPEPIEVRIPGSRS